MESKISDKDKKTVAGSPQSFGLLLNTYKRKGLYGTGLPITSNVPTNSFLIPSKRKLVARYYSKRYYVCLTIII